MSYIETRTYEKKRNLIKCKYAKKCVQRIHHCQKILNCTIGRHVRNFINVIEQIKLMSERIWVYVCVCVCLRFVTVNVCHIFNGFNLFGFL